MADYSITSAVRQRLIEKGLAPHQADGLVGGFMQEFGPGLNANKLGDGGKSFGIGQWNGDRLKGLLGFAKANGSDYTNPLTQADYAVHELGTTEKRAGDMLRAAKTPEEAARAAIGFERPAGFTWDNPTAGHGWDNRLANAQSLPTLLGGGSMQGVSVPNMPGLSINSSPATASMAPPGLTPEAPAATPDAKALDKDWSSGLDMIGKALKGNGSSGQTAAADTQMAPMSNFSAEQGARTQAAQSLMAQIMQARRPRGLI